MALPGDWRIKKKEFQEVQEKGKVYQSDNFGVCVLNRRNKECSRFAFVVSKKISLLAVHRNRIKRSLSEAVRQSMIFIPKGYSMIFLPKKSIARRSTEEIMNEVRRFLKKDIFKK